MEMLRVLGELWPFMIARTKLWRLPIFVVLVGGLLALAQGSALAPLTYTIV